MKTGRAHTESLLDGRTVYIDGRRVDDVTVDPAFRNAVGSIAALYDRVAAPESSALMTYAADGGRFNRVWQLPRSLGDLVERRAALEAWSEMHGGFIGRGPDHVGSCIAGMYMGLPVFESHDPKRAAAVADYYHYARNNDIYLTYAMINPQADRSKAASEQSSEFLSAGVVDRDARGITVRGAKMLATGAVMANEIFVTCIQPLRPGDEKYAISFVLPLSAPGLKILSRKSYEESAASTFDNPLAARFDENDAVIYFDDVLVPWERVFVDSDLDMCQKQFHATPAHVYQNYQSMIRLTVKLRFLLGIARRIAETNGIIGLPPVREMLGQLAAETAMVDALVVAMEAKGQAYGPYFIPNRSHALYGASADPAALLEGVGDAARTGRRRHDHATVDVPRFRQPRDRRTDRRHPAVTAQQRARQGQFYKLAWDAVGSEFGSRHQQYEMFYAGATFVTKAHSFRTYDWDRATRLVDAMLAGYDLPAPADPWPPHDKYSAMSSTVLTAPGVLDTRFRSALARMAARGRLHAYTAPVDPELETAGIMKRLDGGPALLFTNVRGHAVPVVGNFLAARENCEAAFGVDYKTIREFIVRALAGPLAPEKVTGAPVQRNVITSGIDVGRLLPVLKHTAADSGRFITAGVVVTRDPESQVYNASYHRLQLVGPNTTAIQLDLGRHLRLAWERARARGEALPIAVCIGTDIALQYTAATMGSQMPENLDELAVAGGLAGRALPVTDAITQSLIVPAESEIVLEGRILPDRTVPEGAVRRVRRLSLDAGRGAAGRDHRRHAPHVADLPRHQRLRPRNGDAAQVRPRGQPAESAHRRRADRGRRRDDRRRPAPLPRRDPSAQDRAAAQRLAAQRRS